MTTPTDPPDWLKNYQPKPGPKQRAHGGFAPGVSGNPSGRPKGVRNKISKVLAEFERKGSAVAQAAIDAALDGDVAAMSIVLQRIEPSLKARRAPVQFALDPSSPLTEQAQQVIAAVSTGVIDADTGRLLIACIGAVANIRTADEYEQRLTALEARK